MTPEKLILARGMARLEKVIREIVTDMRNVEDDGSSIPLLSFGQGAFRRNYYPGKEGALLSLLPKCRPSSAGGT